MTTLSYVGYILTLIGGILIVVFAVIDLLGTVFIQFSPLFFLSTAARGLLELIIGVIAIIGSKYVTKLAWAIALLILGIVAGGLGGTLVLIGAILGLVSILTKTA